MTKANQIKQLIASYGRPGEFRAVAMKIIEDEHRKGHLPLAANLRRVLDATVNSESIAPKRGLTQIEPLSSSADDLLEIVEPKRGLDSLVLASDARKAIERVLEENRRADELQRHSLPVRSKLLLCGPPGCGKTVTAEVIARELSLPLYTAKLDVLISSLLGQTATNLRRMFDLASRTSSVLFLDEFDALARARNDASEHNELRRVVNSLLLLIDRYKSRGLLIAATNLETSLDPAIWRRFDDVIALDRPEASQIEDLLKLEFKNFPVNFDLGGQVPKLTGFSFADIERIALDAIKTAVMKKRKAVSETEFAAALRQETRRRSLSARDNATR